MSACRVGQAQPQRRRLIEIAAAALGAGADGLTLVNTLLGLALDPETGRPVLGAGGGGLSGAAVHPVAVRAVWECRAAFPDAAIVGVGGVVSGEDAVELLRGRGRRRAGGHGHLPRPPGRRGRSCAELERWCRAGTRRSTRHGRPPGHVARRPGGDATESVARRTPVAEDAMADGFGTGVTAAVARPGPAVRRHRPVGRPAGRWGLTDDAAGLRAFCRACVEAFAGAVAVVKPQVAFFERHGVGRAGRARAPDRRGEPAGLWSSPMPSGATSTRTAAAYAEAWLSESSPLAADAVTAHAVPRPRRPGALAVLAGQTAAGSSWWSAAPTPRGGRCKRRVTADGRAVEDMLLARDRRLNAADGCPSVAVGAVIGATLSRVGFALAQLGGLILAPGLGAQGAAPADVAARFAGCAPRARCCRAAHGACSRPVPTPPRLRRRPRCPRTGGRLA